ncbi:hypothetical protein QW060_27220 [Myroides ceti]|uniref:Uncharacterized protein n=1 Tax=Paenimyroides ceti TaxID=395087 RepID=A0ABT8D113_9FLAO|nr:hypothetical protein [Paenimyroides ceti]MDN3710495.1 hypothetical protein [Paenimyroides ceti]
MLYSGTKNTNSDIHKLVFASIHLGSGCNLFIFSILFVYNYTLV